MGAADELMSAPAVLFFSLIAVLWVWSLFLHPQAACTRCQRAAPRFVPSRARPLSSCRICGGTGRRERPGVSILRTLGWDIGPSGRLRRHG